MQEQASHQIFLRFKFCNNCSFVELSNNEILDFLTSNPCLLNFCRDSMTNAKVYQGFLDDKKIEEHWCRLQTTLKDLEQGFVTGGKFLASGKFYPCNGKLFLIWCSEKLFYSNT